MAENTVPERRERAARRFGGVHAVLAFVAVSLVALPFAALVFLVAPSRRRSFSWTATPPTRFTAM